MKIILLQDVKGIGKRGDIKDVSDGYARNFLLPKKMAEAATETGIKVLEIQKKKEAETQQADLEKTEMLAEKLEGREIIIAAKEKDGKLFGSINAKNITKELRKEGIQISEKSVILPENIKEIGEYDVKIELAHGIETSIRVIIEGAK